jgi:cyclase
MWRSAQYAARLTRSLVAAAALVSGSAAAQPSAAAAPLEVVPGTFVFAEPEGNVVVHVGPRDTFIVGVLAPAAGAQVREFLASRHAPAVRFALAADGPNAARYGDGGWGRSGAMTIAHEHLRLRMLAAFSDPARGEAAGAELPALGFSAVQQMYLSDDQAHAVYQQAGAGDADLSVHLEAARVLYLGTLLTTNGYPALDLDNGGSIDGLIKTIEWFVSVFGSTAGTVFVPLRGPIADGKALDEYLRMLVAARGEVQELLAQDLSDAEIARRDPLRNLDGRWGQGRVSSEQFTQLICRSLRPKAPVAPAPAGR